MSNPPLNGRSALTKAKKTLAPETRPIPSLRHVNITEDVSTVEAILEELRQKNKIKSTEAQQSLITKQKHYVDFLKELTIDIIQLNVLIDDYNRITDRPLKLKKLREIYQQQQDIDKKYPPECISKCPSYQEVIQVRFFKNLQQQFTSLGITTLRLNTTPSTFADILANMAPEKVSDMLKILSDGAQYNKSNFQNLYQGENSTEATAFNDFFEEHSISFLGGGNSKNFKITSLANGTSVVLKVDNRLNMPRDAEAYLRKNSLQDALTPIFAERQATYSEATNLPITRTILITEFCQGGNLQEHPSQYPNENDRLQSALSIYSQMAHILKNIQDDHGAFPDMKNSNWLVDSKGMLRIADTKSLVFTDSRGRLDYNIPANKWYKKVSTRYMNPPELTSTETPSVDKIHSCMLGKNLYRYLTQCSSEDLNGEHDASHYNFTAPIFLTTRGLQLKMLISKLIKPNPADRIGINAALDQLKRIQTEHFSDECHAVLLQINALGLGTSDIAMQKFTQQKTIEISSSTTIDQLVDLKKELDSTLSLVKNSPIMDIIQSFHDRARFYTIGMKAKAERIERAILMTPINERHDIMKSQTPEALNVQKALASHRFFWNQGKEINKKDGTIITGKAAQSFNNYKTTFTNIDNPNDTDEPDHDPSTTVRK